MPEKSVFKTNIEKKGQNIQMKISISFIQKMKLSDNSESNVRFSEVLFA